MLLADSLYYRKELGRLQCMVTDDRHHVLWSRVEGFEGVEGVEGVAEVVEVEEVEGFCRVERSCTVE